MGLPITICQKVSTKKLPSSRGELQQKVDADDAAALARSLAAFPALARRRADALGQPLSSYVSRPNTMNERGFLLDEAGLTPTVTEPLFAFAARLARRLYPDLEALDHHRCFTVEYEVGGDVDLAAHFDNSEVTLNVCLSASADRVGGDLVFSDGTAVAHRPGYAVFHRGSAVHAATELSSGSRTNLVLWCRSTRQRRRTGCPLCGETRNLVF